MPQLITYTDNTEWLDSADGGGNPEDILSELEDKFERGEISLDELIYTATHVHHNNKQEKTMNNKTKTTTATPIKSHTFATLSGGGCAAYDEYRETPTQPPTKPRSRWPSPPAPAMPCA